MSNHPIDPTHGQVPARVPGWQISSTSLPGHDPLESPAEDTFGWTVAYIFQLALRRWGVVFIPVGVLLALAGVALVWLLYEPEYVATGWIRLRTDVATVVIATTGQRPASSTSQKIQPELVRTPFVIGPVLSRPEIANLPEILEEASPQDWLPSQIKVDSDGSGVIKVQYQSADTDAARKIVDAVIGEYEKIYDTDSKRKINNQLAEIKQQLDATQDLIEESHVELTSLMQPATGQSGPPSPHHGERALLRSKIADAVIRYELAKQKLNAFLEGNLEKRPVISDERVDELLAKQFDPVAFRESMEQEFAGSGNWSSTDSQAGGPRRIDSQQSALPELVNQERERRRAVIRERLELLAAREHLVEQAPKSTPDQVRGLIDDHQDVALLDDALRVIREELQEFQSRLKSGVDHKGLQDLKDELSELEKQREEHHTRLAEELVAEYNRQAEQSVLNRFERLVTDLFDARIEQSVLHNRLLQLSSLPGAPSPAISPSQEVFADSSKIETVKKELAAELVVLEELVRQELVLTMQSGLRDNQLASMAATISTKPINEWPIRNMMLAILCGFALPCGVAMLWEWHVKRISNADQFADALGIPILGEIARLPQTPRAVLSRSGTGAERAATIYEQSTLVVSDNISHSRHLRSVKVMAISSAVKGEGKSHLAAKLAVNLARVMNGRVLLVDGDIRFRSAEKLLQVPAHQGLSEVMREECTLDEAIYTDRQDGLHVMTAGGPDSRSYHLIRNGVLGGIFQELRDRYQFVIIDTPPILSAGESLSFGKVADGTVICALRDVSRIPQTRKALARLFSVGVHPLGAILAGIPASSYENSYHAYAYGQVDCGPELESEPEETPIR